MVGNVASPYDILALCCEKMAELRMEWKVVDEAYKLKVKSCTDHLKAGVNMEEFMKHYFLKFTLQVQRVSEMLNLIDIEALKRTYSRFTFDQRKTYDLHRLLLQLICQVEPGSLLSLPPFSLIIIKFIVIL